MASAAQKRKTLQKTLPVARPVTPLGILVEQLEHIVEIAKSEPISPQLTASLQEVYQLAAGLDPYLESCTTAESAALANLTQKDSRRRLEPAF